MEDSVGVLCTKLHAALRLAGMLGLSILLYTANSDAAQIALAWDSVAQATGYMVYYGPASRQYTSSMDVGANNTLTLSNLAAEETYYFAVTAYDSAGNESAYSNEVSTTIVPAIEANGAYGSVVLRTSDILSLTVELNAFGHSELADWWVAADTPFGWYYYQYATDSWSPAIPSSYTNLSYAYQGPLFDVDAHEVLRISGLPPGSYLAYFGVDTIMNGSLDLDHLYADYVAVDITP